MDWLGNRSHVRHRYVRVSWATWEELEQYGNITGGSTEWSYFTDLKVQGSLSYNGSAPSQLDLVRDYYSFTDDGGESVEVCVSTMLCEMAKSTILSPGRVSGSVDCYSVLKVASDRQLGFPYTIKAGSHAVTVAQSIAEGLGLRVNSKPSDYVTAADHTFDAADTMLAVINWLLASAGYSSAYPDAYGVVQMQPYVEPTTRKPIFEFSDAGRSIMYPKPDNELDRTETPNVVRMSYEDDYETLWAYASNIDPDNGASLPARGNRERTMVETADDLTPAYPEENGVPVITDEVQGQRVESLKAAALKKLVDNSAEIEYVEIKHGFYPVTQGDPVSVRYADRTWSGTVTNIKLDHAVNSACTTKIRRYVTADLKTETGGGAL
jgi:hypothetical protein